MSERPILFSGKMVRAILDGRKTQTRRVIKPQHIKLDGGGHPYIDMGHPDEWDGAGLRRDVRCPYGQPGDRLWVRETWATPGNYDDIKPSELSASCFTHADLAYRATEPYGDAYYRWRPSIFMPRWISRITLTVTSVRVQRVQNIVPMDCYAEGAYTAQDITNAYHGLRCWGQQLEIEFALQSFKQLWNSINAKRGSGWDTNPWVWVISFARDTL